MEKKLLILMALMLLPMMNAAELDAGVNDTLDTPNLLEKFILLDNTAKYEDIEITPMMTNDSELSSWAFDWESDTKGFWIDTGNDYSKVPLTEFHWKVTRLKTSPDCSATSMYGISCSYDTINFDTFIEKNNINSSNSDEFRITPIYSKAEEPVLQYYIVSFYGNITNLDPSFTVSSYSTGDGWFNATSTSLGHGVSGDAPILSMQFDVENDSTHVRDDSIENNHGTLNGNPTYNSSCTSGQGGGCYEFDGNGDYIDVSSYSSSTNESISVFTWINPQELEDFTGIVSNLNNNGPFEGWVLYLNASGNIGTYLGNHRITNLTISTNTWSYIGFTYDGNNLNTYINGVLNRTDTSVGYVGNNILRIGRFDVDNNIGSSKQFNGSIDNVQIWNRVLSAEEILALNNTPNNYGKFPVESNYTYFTYWNESNVSWISNYSIADSDGENITDIAPANLVSYWPLDNSPLDSVGSNDGTINGGVLNGTGLSSDAYTFDGNGDFINISNEENFRFNSGSQDFSVFLWYYHDSAPANDQFFFDKRDANDDGWRFQIFTNDTIQFNLDTIDISSENALDYNWHHVGVVIDRDGNGQIYIDGVADGSPIAIGGEAMDTTSYFNIGVRSFSVGTAYINGSIDEVAIWNTSLTAAQIEEVYKAGLSQHANTNISLETRTATSYNISDANLTALWACNDGNTTHCNDETGVNNGTFNGNTAVGDEYGVVGQGLDFDGNGDYVDLSSNVNNFEQMDSGTYSVWFIRRSTAQASVFGINNDNQDQFVNIDTRPTRYDLYVRHAPNFSNQIRVDTTLNQDQWYHLVWTSNGTNYKSYLNGVEQTIVVQAGADDGKWFKDVDDFTDLTEMYLGVQEGFTADTKGQYFNGSVDEVRIYNRSLSAAEVTDLYEMGSYHIEWNAWDDEGVLSDGTSDTSTSTGNFFQQRMKFNTNDTDVSPFLLAHNVTVLEDTTPTIVLDDSYGVDSDGASITDFTSDNLEEIENLILNFSVTTTGTIDTWYLNFTANGTNGCSLGNKQSAYCYNWTGTSEWIYFLEGNETDTYNDTGGAVGDRITVARSGDNSDDDIDFTIDEHYNPNVAKHYEALYNFSNLSWQDGADQRIHQDNYLLINFSTLFVPNNADQYKLDFRVQNTSGTNTPGQPIEAWACNSTYTTGDVIGNDNCVLVTQKLPEELQDDGTKFRGVFTKSLITGINEIEYVVLRTDENNPNKYYSIKSYGITNATHSEMWAYSTDTGTSWTNATEGYESEMNINWFYAGNNNTEFIYNLWVNTTSGDSANLVGNISWEINATNNYPPIVNIITPDNNASTNETININWTISEPNNDGTIVNLTLSNGTDFILVTNAFNNTTTYSFDPSTYADGAYNLTVNACENATADLFCGNDTHILNIDNPDSPTGSLTNDTLWTRNWDGAVTTVGYSESNDNDADVTYKIYKDGVDVGASDTEQEIGTYVYVLNTTGGANWTLNANMDTQTLVINSLANYPSNLSVDIADSYTGTLGSLQADDADYLEVAENSSSPSLLIAMNFSGYANYDDLQMEYSYDGGTGHEFTLEALNDSNVWVSIGTLDKTTGYEVVNFSITQGSYDNGDIFKLRINGTDSGNNGHTVGFDYIKLRSVVGETAALAGVCRVTPSELTNGIPHVSFKTGDQVFR